MVEGQYKDHDRGSRAGEQSRLGGLGRGQGWGQVRGRAKVRGVKGRGHGQKSRCWSPRGSRV